MAMNWFPMTSSTNLEAIESSVDDILDPDLRDRPSRG
jgi:hypothetical protein